MADLRRARCSLTPGQAWRKWSTATAAGTCRCDGERAAVLLLIQQTVSHQLTELLGNHGHVVLIDNESGIEAHPQNIASNMCTIGIPRPRPAGRLGPRATHHEQTLWPSLATVQQLIERKRRKRYSATPGSVVSSMARQYASAASATRPASASSCARVDQAG